MIRVVFDANTVVSGLPATSGTLAELIDRWRFEQFQLVLSPHILTEVERAWNKPYWQSRFPADRAAFVLQLLREHALIIPITARVLGVATHPEDDLVLATAISARVPYLVTGDNGLLRVGQYDGVTILAPRVFITLLDQHSIGES